MRVNGEQEPFKVVALEEITNVKHIPEFDFSLKWKPREDMPPGEKCHQLQACRQQVQKVSKATEYR